MKYIKSFEYGSTKIFKDGDLVKFKSPNNEYGDDIFIVNSHDISKYGNTSNLWRYDKYIKYIKKQANSILGTGWIDNDEIEKISEEEEDALKYNL